MADIDISGLHKGAVVAALFNASRPQGLGALNASPGLITPQIGEKILAHHGGGKLDYVQGRVMKVDVSGDTLDPSFYDRDLGEGAAAAAIEPLRSESARRPPPPDIHAVLMATTEMFRKGEEVIDHPPDHAGIRVTEVFSMPHEKDAAEGLDMVDLHFVKVGVKPREAESHRDELLAWCRAYPEPNRLAGGPSYIEIGAIIGSQDDAFRLFALGQHLDFWEVITPELLGLSGADARTVAGRGFVMITGWKGA